MCEIASRTAWTTPRSPSSCSVMAYAVRSFRGSASGANSQPQLNREALASITVAQQLATEMDDEYVSTDDLLVGLATGRPLLQQVLGSAYPGLDADGWKKLTRNWALFFLFMAVLNESVWRNSSTSFWIGFKIWGALPLTFLFAAANIPMLLKHGLMKEDAEPVEPGPIE